MKKNIVSIKDFGAESNGELQTEKIQAAIDYCFQNGGGEVQIPEGVYLTGGIRLRSNITLHLLKNATLKGSRNPEDYFGYLHDKVEALDKDFITDGPWNRAEVAEVKDYRFMRIPGSRWNNSLIRAISAENIAIIGDENSYIDGSDCFDELGEENYRGPHAIGFYYCKNIYLNGYIVKDSANWAHSIFYSDNIICDNVQVEAGHDGIHMTVCNNIKITNCRFYTGDDCVAGFSNTNVYVGDCELNSACSAMRFGGTNVLVEKCHIYAPCKYYFRGSMTDEEKRSGAKAQSDGRRNNMLSVFTYYADYSMPIYHTPGNIVIKDCEIDGADRFLHYNYSGNEMWQDNKPMESIRFENIEAKNISMPLTAYGDKEAKVTVEIKNTNISFRDGAVADSFMNVCNYDKIILKNVNVDNYKGECLIKAWSDGNIESESLNCGISKEKMIKKTDEIFECEPI